MPLASALGLGMLAGARLYATVFAVGLLLRFDWVNLPAAWQHASVLADTRFWSYPQGGQVYAAPPGKIDCRPKV